MDIKKKTDNRQQEMKKQHWTNIGKQKRDIQKLKTKILDNGKPTWDNRNPTLDDKKKKKNIG